MLTLRAAARRPVRWARKRLGADPAQGRGAVGDRGGSAIEFVFLTPMMFLLIFGAVQFALYAFAQDVAKSAAQAATREGRSTADLEPGWQVGAEAKGRHYITSLSGEAGSGVLRQPRVDSFYANPAQTVVRTEVTGTVPTLVFGLTLTVSVSSEGPVERFVDDVG